MPVYKFSPEGNADLKKTWTRTMLVYYAVIILVFAYNLLYKNGTTLTIGIFAVIIVALAAGYIFGRKKYFAIMDSTQLIATDNDITLRVLDRPDVTMAFSNIKEMIHRKDGIYLQSKTATKSSLLIINKFENFYEIEKLITDKVHQNSLPAAS
ncbi:MAG: hypothetical protein JWP67_3251 [Mucilaginibacter sp.]|nr:hypothetical protein [Mucilaginibacter sp.]